MGHNRMGPDCPNCGSRLTRVDRTVRSSELDFWRQRECPICGHKFATIQRAERPIKYRHPAISWDIATRRINIDWSAFDDRPSAIES